MEKIITFPVAGRKYWIWSCCFVEVHSRLDQFDATERVWVICKTARKTSKGHVSAHGRILLYKPSYRKMFDQPALKLPVRGFHSLSNLFQCLTISAGRKFFLLSNLNFLFCSITPLIACPVIRGCWEQYITTRYQIAPQKKGKSKLVLFIVEWINQNLKEECADSDPYEEELWMFSIMLLLNTWLIWKQN